jgi:hypothetical protein
MHPHYQFAVWWVVPVGLACALGASRRVSRWAGRGAMAGLLLLALVQMQFIGDWMRYVRRHGGTEGIHYGSVLSEQKQIVASACRLESSRLSVLNATRLFPQSLRYLASVEKRCEGKTVAFCGQDPCGRGADNVFVRIDYEKPGDARLQMAVDR